MKTWLTADLHLGEDRFEIMQRPFKNRLEHNETILYRHNEVVAKNDWVYVIGDAVYQKVEDPEGMMQWFDRLNGRKILIRGNHDRPFSDEQFSKYFEQIVPEGQGVEMEFGGIPCYLTHYPTCGRSDRFNLVGHIHGAFKFQLNMLNVGVDAHHFRPVDSDQVAFYYKAITEYYDADVWCAYNPINKQYVGLRGKNTSYFAAV